MTNIEFVERLKQAVNCNTLYVKGGFGATAGYKDNRKKYINLYEFNNLNDRASLINSCDNDTFFFDCICLGKGILWGWCGDYTQRYGGAIYKSNGVDDFSVENAMKYCTDVSTDFTAPLIVGEWLYKPGHIGYYIGNGMTIEATIAEKDGCQIKKVSDTKWIMHGKCKYIDYNADKRTIICPCCGKKFIEV